MFKEAFKNRREAGRMLAERLSWLKREDCIVLSIPRGGVEIGFEVAKALRSDLDVVVPRKLGAPSNPELAIGAIAEDESIALNEDIISFLGVDKRYVKEEARRQLGEIKRRLKVYRVGGEPRIEGRVVVLVDDGIATGATIKAAIKSIKAKGPKKLILAVPVGPESVIEELKEEVDEVVCIKAPMRFYAIGEFYDDFRQLDDDYVRTLLTEALSWKEPRD